MSIITDRTDWSSQEIVQANLCHILVCIMALTCLKVIEMKIKDQGYEITSHKIMQHMQKLHQVLTFYKKTRKATKGLEEADENQSQILKAFGYKIDGYVLRKI